MNPIWAELPENFKRNVVNHLDLKSRENLGGCSSQDRKLVKSCAIALEQVIFLVTSDDVSVHFRDFSYSNRHRFYRTSDSNCIRRLLEHPSSTVDTLTINKSKDIETDKLTSVIQQLLFQEPKTLLKVQKFDWNCCQGRDCENFDSFLMMLELLDSSVLKVLTIRGGECWKVYDCYYADNSRITHSFANAKEMEKISKTKHWNQLKKVNFHCILDNHLVVDHFFHLEKIRVDVNKWSIEMIWQLIQNFRIKGYPRNSYFKLYNIREDFPLSEMIEHFKKEDVTEENEVRLGFIQGLLHTQTFPICSSVSPDDENLVLIVLFEQNKVRGLICQKEFIREDCQSSFEFVM